MKAEDVAALSRELAQGDLAPADLPPGAPEAVSRSRAPGGARPRARSRAVSRRQVGQPAAPAGAARAPRQRALRRGVPRSPGDGALPAARPRARSRSARVVLEQHNVESDFFGQFAAKQRGPVPLRRRRRAPAGAALRAARRSPRWTATVAISADDARAFSAMSGKPAELVPQVVRFTRRPYRAGVAASAPLRREPRLAPQRTAGLDWFCRDGWPHLRERAPELTLNIIGSGLRLENGASRWCSAAWKRAAASSPTASSPIWRRSRRARRR